MSLVCSMLPYRDLEPEIQAHIQKQKQIFIFVNFAETFKAPWLTFVRATDFADAWKLNMQDQSLSFVQLIGLITIEDLLKQIGPLGAAPLKIVVNEPTPTMTNPEHLAAYLRDHGYAVNKI